MQLLAGHVEDDDGFEHEVWIETHENGTKDHVYGMYGGGQTFDFPFDQPDKDCELCEAAQMVATSDKLMRMSLPILVMAAG